MARMVKNGGLRGAQGNLIPADRQEAHLDALLGAEKGFGMPKLINGVSNYRFLE